MIEIDNKWLLQSLFIMSPLPFDPCKSDRVCVGHASCAAGAERRSEVTTVTHHISKWAQLLAQHLGDLLSLLWWLQQMRRRAGLRPSFRGGAPHQDVCDTPTRALVLGRLGLLTVSVTL